MKSTAVSGRIIDVLSFIPRKRQTLHLLAGLLTYSVFEILPIKKQWIIIFKNFYAELTAAGLFRIFTEFPFKRFLGLTRFRQR